MAITVNVKSMDEVPDYMREFVMENEGVFSYDSDRAFAALKAERDISKTAKSELAPFKALNIAPDQIKAFMDLGKTAPELAELIAKANAPVPKPNVKTTTEYLELEQRFKNLESMQKEWEATKAENLRNKRNGLVRKLISEMPDEYDKELFGSFVENSMMDKFALDDTKEALSPVDNQLPAEFLKAFADKYRFKKASTPGNAAPGNAPISATGSAFSAAKEKGDVAGMIANAPEIE